MSVAISPPEKTLMTAEEFLALPEDGVHRELIHGELVELAEPATQNHGPSQTSPATPVTANSARQ